MIEREPQIRHYDADDGYRLYYRHWTPDEEPRGRVLYLHGIQSHGGWYLESCRRLAQASFEVFFAERRGSGLNEAERGDAPNTAQLVSDVVQLLEVLRRPDPRRPVILLAVSWGAKLAVAGALARPELLDGLGLLYPGLFSRFGPTVMQRFLLRLARAVGMGGRRLPIPLGDPALFTDVDHFRAYIAQDPLALRRVTLRFLLAGLELDRLLEGAEERLRLPTLVMLAGRDRIVDNARTRAFFERLCSPDRILIEYADAQHTLEFAADPELFLRDLIWWVTSTSERVRQRAQTVKPAGAT